MRASGVRFDSYDSDIARVISRTLKHAHASAFALLAGAPGAFVHHQSLQPHGMTTLAEPMLAL